MSIDPFGWCAQRSSSSSYVMHYSKRHYLVHYWTRCVATRDTESLKASFEIIYNSFFCLYKTRTKCKWWCDSLQRPVNYYKIKLTQTSAEKCSAEHMNDLNCVCRCEKIWRQTSQLWADKKGPVPNGTLNHCGLPHFRDVMPLWLSGRSLLRACTSAATKGALASTFLNAKIRNGTPYGLVDLTGTRTRRSL